METGQAKDSLDILHHVGVINTNLHILAERYEKLGFLLSPVSTPRIVIEPGGEPTALGVGNRHAIFEENFLELLGIVDPQQWASIPKEKIGPYNIDLPLTRYQGLHVMHFGTDHIEWVKERFHQQEIPCSAIKNFQRNVQTDAGEQTMRARTLAFAPSITPEGLVQVAQTDTPSLVFQPQYMVHSNGALALTELVLCCTHPREYVSKYEQLTGHKGFEMKDNYFIIDLGRSSIIVLTAADLGNIVPGFTPPAIPFMAAITVETSDLQLTGNVLLKNDVPFTEINERIIVDPRYAGGCAVIFKARYK